MLASSSLRAWRHSIRVQAQSCSSGSSAGCFSASVKRYANFACGGRVAHP
jgi:hypothetical protein